jgi:hypothetical protein
MFVNDYDGIMRIMMVAMASSVSDELMVQNYGNQINKDTD